MVNWRSIKCTAVGSTEAPLVPSLARQRWRINKSAPDRSELLPNRRLLGLGDEEGLGRLFADGARGGEHTRALGLAFGCQAGRTIIMRQFYEAR